LNRRIGDLDSDSPEEKAPCNSGTSVGSIGNSSNRIPKNQNKKINTTEPNRRRQRPKKEEKLSALTQRRKSNLRKPNFKPPAFAQHHFAALICTILGLGRRRKYRTFDAID
jgi:hypothetical protein